ncbi:hypothetical protein A9Q74_08780 [Colwellia sp. 39_35_sub15_T18]|nr:hypothetical protein A9Q74_08780 [Colwellia sp. 39_35_sub15_T18]
MNEENAYKLAYEREKSARLLAEKLLEKKTRELYDNVLNLEGAVSELKLTQSQLIQSEKMASLGKITAGIAHEINNPIGYSYSNLSCLAENLIDYFSLDSIIQNSNVLQEDPSFVLKKYRQKHKQINANYIIKDCPSLLCDSLEGLDRVKSIINNLKKISYKGNNEFISCSINECINDCIKVVDNEFKYSMDVNLELEDCANICGQPADLIQVFINLFINASHACSENGLLSIKSHQENRHIIIRIKDNGKGINESIQQNIFDPFFTTKLAGEGTGLGLSVSHGIIEKHGGTIKVQSDGHDGTCFIIKLPIEE